MKKCVDKKSKMIYSYSCRAVSLNILQRAVIDGETFDTTKLKIMDWCNVHQVHAVREGNFYYMDWVN